MNTRARLFLSLCTAAAVVLYLLADTRDTGPGPITSVHAQVAELQGGKACVLCHGTGPDAHARGAGVEHLAQACLDCHEVIQDQIDAESGLHGGLSVAQRRLCGECHVEHLGADLALTDERAFRLAGHDGPSGFDHSTVDYDLHGRHDALACVDCHPAADKAVLAEGESRYLGKTQTCLDCHEDVHDGQMRRGCAACHGQEHDFDDLSAFPHDERFPLHYAHGGLSCAECHEPDSAHSVEALSDAAIAQNPLLSAWRACAACHESPHTSSFIENLPAPQVPHGPGQDSCVLCHSERHDSWRGEQVEFEETWHSASGFDLAKPHAKLQCAACHVRGDDGEQSFTSAYPGRAAQQCAACHQDVHQGQFLNDAGQTRACLECHAQDQFLESNFDVAAHARAGFALEDSHATIECNACHDQLRPGFSDAAALAPHAAECRVYVGTARRCEECHSDAHRGAFSALEAQRGTPELGSCASCHNATRFDQTIDDFDHELWTAFALVGGHATDSCAACHEASAQADQHGRRFGHVSELFPGDSATCVNCHADVHAGAFGDAALPNQVDGRLGCDRCHNVHAFNQLHGPFDHGAWTNYALDGAHAAAACTSCHGQAQELRSFGLVADHYPGDASSCATCHSDPHLGIFDRDQRKQSVLGRQDCARCHETRSFQAAALGSFDHGYWTEFELSGAHGKAQCSACHVELPQLAEHGRSYERAAGRACHECHSDPHVGQFLQQGKQDCARCHDELASSWQLPSFDHDQTAFALDATHAKVACNACHTSEPLRSGGEAVRYKPMGTACMDCHAVLPGPASGGGG